MRALLVFVLLAACGCAVPAYSAIIVGYNPAYHTREGIGAGYNWGAVSQQGRLTMITPLWGITANHYPASGPQVFPDGTRTIVQSIRVNGFADLQLQRLNAPVSSWVGIADGRAGEYFLLARDRVALNPLTFTSGDRTFFRFNGMTDEAFLQSGDSGGPALFPYAGRLWLLSTHLGISGSGQVGSYSIGSDVESYMSQIEAITGDVALITDVRHNPEPSAGLLALALALTWFAAANARRRQLRP